MPTPQDPAAAFAAFLGDIPVARSLGFDLLARTDDECTLQMPVADRHLQNDARVHGGIVATLADTAAVWLLRPALPVGRGLTSIEFKLNFLRPARADGGALRASARLVKRGRTVCVSDVEVHQGVDLVAKGLFTYLVYES
ncbi:MAG: PaaI family thioesterase [Planctomycetota bacterium]